MNNKETTSNEFLSLYCIDVKKKKKKKAKEKRENPVMLHKVHGRYKDISFCIKDNQQHNPGLRQLRYVLFAWQLKNSSMSLYLWFAVLLPVLWAVCVRSLSSHWRDCKECTHLVRFSESPEMASWLWAYRVHPWNYLALDTYQVTWNIPCWSVAEHTVPTGCATPPSSKLIFNWHKK